MIAAPVHAEEVEQSRAHISGEAQRIYDATERDVNAEIERLDAAKAWAVTEMDRITAAARADLERGRDPDAVERQVELDIAAVVEKASAPGFDPRPPKPPATPTVAPSPAPAPPPVVPPIPALPPTPAPAALEPPATTPVSVTPVAAPGAQACGCGHGSRPPATLVLALLLLLGSHRRRG